MLKKEKEKPTYNSTISSCLPKIRPILQIQLYSYKVVWSVGTAKSLKMPYPLYKMYIIPTKPGHTHQILAWLLDNVCCINPDWQCKSSSETPLKCYLYL